VSVVASYKSSQNAAPNPSIPPSPRSCQPEVRANTIVSTLYKAEVKATPDSIHRIAPTWIMEWSILSVSPVSSIHWGRLGRRSRPVADSTALKQ
jgi:hypothetical protein